MPKKSARKSGKQDAVAAEPLLPEPMGGKPLLPEPVGGKRKSTGAPAKDTKKKSRPGLFPTVEDIASDPLTQLANQHWGPAAGKKKFEKKVVEDVYLLRPSVPFCLATRLTVT